MTALDMGQRMKVVADLQSYAASEARMARGWPFLYLEWKYPSGTWEELSFSDIGMSGHKAEDVLRVRAAAQQRSAAYYEAARKLMGVE